MNWTDERVEQLRKLWADGLSASQIAAQMGGVTRNAVIGKVHRLKLSSRGKSTSSQPRVKKSAHAPILQSTRTSTRAGSIGTGANGASAIGTSRIGGGGAAHAMGATALKTEYQTNAVSAQVIAFAPPLVAPESKRLMLVELSENTCKWPIGDPMSAEFNFCGNDAGSSGPYCQFHAKLAYQPASDRRRPR